MLRYKIIWRALKVKLNDLGFVNREVTFLFFLFLSQKQLSKQNLWLFVVRAVILCCWNETQVVSQPNIFSKNVICICVT